MTRVSPQRSRLILWALALGVTGMNFVVAEPTPSRPITWLQCLEQALRLNLGLQVERLNPGIARDQLGVAQGYYDPQFTTDSRWERASDSGGFDPVDFSRDAVYSADSTAVRTGVTGFAPTGLSYTLTGSYAHSEGERNLLNFDSYGVAAGVAVEQPLLKNLWVDAPRLTIQLNRKWIEITEQGIRWTLLDLVNQVHWAYLELVFATEHRQLQEQIQESRQRLLAGLNRQVQQGVLTPTDTLPAQVEWAAGEAALVASENSVALASHALQQLIQDDFQANHGTLRPFGPLPAATAPDSLPTSWSRGLASRPDLAQLRIEVERGELNVRFRRNQLFPSLNVVAGYGRRGASTGQLPPPLQPQASASDAFGQLRDGDVPSDFVGLVFSLPFTRSAERSAFRASRKLKEQAELRVRQLEAQVLREIADAYSTVQSARQRAAAAATAVALAGEAMRAEERKLAGGRSSVFFVLQLQDEYLTAQTTELRARIDHLQALSQLRFAEGSLPDSL